MSERTDNQAARGYAARFGLFLARFCITAWIGAAALFVIVGITEVTQSGFDSTTKDRLVSVRFPAFYACGATLVSAGWLGAFAARDPISFPSNRRIVTLAILAIVLVTMLADYFWIYQALLKMVTPPGQAKPSSFRDYHEASKWINLAGLVLCLVASVLVNWPRRVLEKPN